MNTTTGFPRRFMRDDEYHDAYCFRCLEGYSVIGEDPAPGVCPACGEQATAPSEDAHLADVDTAEVGDASTQVEFRVLDEGREIVYHAWTVDTATAVGNDALSESVDADTLVVIGLVDFGSYRVSDDHDDWSGRLFTDALLQAFASAVEDYPVAVRNIDGRALTILGL